MSFNAMPPPPSYFGGAPPMPPPHGGSMPGMPGMMPPPPSMSMMPPMSMPHPQQPPSMMSMHAPPPHAAMGAYPPSQPYYPPPSMNMPPTPSAASSGFTPSPRGPGGVLLPAPTYVHPTPFPTEAELAARPVPTENCDPFDETYPTYNVFIGDLTPDFTEADMYAAFQAAGPIHSVLVVRDKVTGVSRGMGFINFLTERAKAYALEHLKTSYSRGIPVRCFVSDAKNSILVSGIPTTLTDPKSVKQELERIGGPMQGDPQMQKPGTWFVSYVNYRRAEKALSLITNKPYGIAGSTQAMTASLAIGKGSGSSSMPPKPAFPLAPGAVGAAAPLPSGSTLFVKNIATSIDDATLSSHFSKHGTVIKSTLVRDPLTQESKGFGFLSFATFDDANKAFNALNGTTLEGKVLNIEHAKIPDGAGARPLGVGASGLPMIGLPSSAAASKFAPAPLKKEPKSRHQNDGDGGFNAPRGFTDAATETRHGITFFDDNFDTDHVPAAAAIAGIHAVQKPEPLMRDGVIVGFGYPNDVVMAGTEAPEQGSEQSKCRIQKQLTKQWKQQRPQHNIQDWQVLQAYAAPMVNANQFTTSNIGGPAGGGFGRGGPMPAFPGGRF